MFTDKKERVQKRMGSFHCSNQARKKCSAVPDPTKKAVPNTRSLALASDEESRDSSGERAQREVRVQKRKKVTDRLKREKKPGKSTYSSQSGGGRPSFSRR